MTPEIGHFLPELCACVSEFVCLYWCVYNSARVSIFAIPPVPTTDLISADLDSDELLARRSAERSRMRAITRRIQGAHARTLQADANCPPICSGRPLCFGGEAR